MSLSIIILLIVSGVAVGFINTLSAGGTTISIALYLAMGIPAQITNAINRVGVLMQNGFAAGVFYKKRILDYRQLLLYSVPVVLGTLTGAFMAVEISEKVFNICFAAVLWLMSVFLFAGNRTYEQKEKPLTLKRYLITFPAFFVTGFYGGFVQAGTGFLLIACIGSLLGYDLLKTTAAKNTIMFIYTVFAMIVFITQQNIPLKYWIYALIHSLGNIIGSFIATKYALKKGSAFVKAVIICVIVLTALNLLGILDMKIFFKNFVN